MPCLYVISLLWFKEVILQIWFEEEKTSVQKEDLTVSWQRSLSYRNQSTDLHGKSMEWFLYVKDLLHENVNLSRIEEKTRNDFWNKFWLLKFSETFCEILMLDFLVHMGLQLSDSLVHIRLQFSLGSVFIALFDSF